MDKTEVGIGVVRCKVSYCIWQDMEKRPMSHGPSWGCCNLYLYLYLKVAWGKGGFNTYGSMIKMHELGVTCI